MSRPLSPEDLYPFRSWVWALAVRLASNEADALDLEQQVWVKVVERPPGNATNLRAWLAQVVRNAAHNMRRAAGRRERHESAVRPSLPPLDAFELAAEAEAQRMLVGAVLELEQPYRDTVLLRWFEGLAPREVAGRQGVPLATVYTRLARAHQQLRDRLDRTHGSRSAWAVLLVPTGRRLLELGSPSEPVSGAGAVAAKSAPTGGALMAATLTKTLGAAALVAILALFAFQGGSHDASSRRDGPSEPRNDVALSRSPRTHTEYNPVPEVPERGAALQDVDPDTDLAGIVVDPTGAPVAGATLTAVDYPWAATGIERETAELLPRRRGRTRSRADGTFALPLRRGDTVNVHVEAEGFAAAEYVLRSAGERTRLVLLPAVRLDVRCERKDGSPVAGVSVLAVTWPPDAEPRVVRRGVSDADGSLGWHDLPAGVKVHVLPRGWSEAVEVTLPDAGSVERVLPFGRGRRITGRVISEAGGEPIPGARVGIGPSGDHLTSSAADGTFTLADWMGGPNGVIRCGASGFASASVRPGDSDEVTISLAPGVRLRGRVVGTNGAPVDGAHVAAFGTDENDAAHRATTLRAVSDEAGQFEIQDVSSECAHRLVVSALGFGRTERAVAASEEDVDLGELALTAPRAIAGRLLADDAGVPRVTIELRVEANGVERRAGRIALRRTDHLGRFRFDDLAPGSYVVSSWGDGGPTGRRTIELPTDVDVLDVELGDASEDGTRTLVVTVVDGEGRPVAGARVVGMSPHAAPIWATTAADGVARLEGSGAASTVHASPPAGDRAWVTPWPGARSAVDGDATTLTLTLVEGLWTTGTVRRADGSVQPRASITARTPSGLWINGRSDDEGRFRLSIPRGEPVVLRWAGQYQSSDTARGSEIVATDEYVEMHDVTPGASELLLQARTVVHDQRLDVRVTLPDGAPAEGIEVWARDLAVNDPTIVRATTDAAGRATLRGLASRPHRLGTGHGDRGLGPARWQEATPGASDPVALALRAMVEITGTVTDATGQPFTHYEVQGKRRRVTPTATSLSPGPQRNRWASSGVESDGAFTIRVPADEPGPFSVEFSLPPDDSSEGSVQLGCTVQGVRPGDTLVRLVIAPLR